MNEEFRRPLSLVEATMDSIRSSIINGKLSLGQKITESFLQKTFGLSKTTIRESLSLLKGEGLVVSETHKGFRVFKMDKKELSEFCDYRLALESKALSIAYNNKN
jgi:DNA-binding GntR family transcriptional regulator